MTTIVLVDDESGQLEIMRRILRNLYPGIEIQTFTSSVKAAEYILNHSVQGVLTDIRMPVMDGLELTGQLRAAKPDLAIAVISAYSDFEYARRALGYGVSEYLVKPISRVNLSELMEKLLAQIDKARVNRERIRQLEDYRPLYVDAQICKWLRGELDSSQSRDLESLFTRHSSGFVAVFKFAAEKETFSGEFKLFCKQSLKSTFSTGQVLSVFLEGGPPLLVGIVSFEETGEKEIAHRLGCFLSDLRREYTITAHAGYGTADTDFAGSVPVCFRQAMEAADHILLTSQPNCFSYTGLSAAERVNSAELYTFEHKLMEYLFQSDISACGKLMKEFCEMLSEKKLAASVQSMREFFAHVIFLAKKQAGVNLDTGGTLAKTASCQYVEQLCGLVEGFFRDIIEIQKRQADKSTKDNVHEIMKYIRRNCNKDITLEQVADMFHFNPTYLSYIFKTHSQSGFKEYIIQVRIERAKELLRTTRLKVYQVASEVGYSDSAYFVRLFKKETGLSPNRYRSLYTENREVPQ